jgi:hypothetical protein
MIKASNEAAPNSKAKSMYLLQLKHDDDEMNVLLLLLRG